VLTRGYVVSTGADWEEGVGSRFSYPISFTNRMRRLGPENEPAGPFHGIVLSRAAPGE
jgi:hypothetical protein